MLQVVRVSAVASRGDGLDKVVVLVFLLHLVVANQHFGKHAGRVFGRLVAQVGKQLYLVLQLLFALQIGQKAQLVEHLVLVQII